MSIDRSSVMDITRVTLAVLCIGILIAACFWILRPFLLPLLWATMIVVATWPLMLGVQDLLGGRRKLAVAVMTLALALVFFIPFTLAVIGIINNSDQIVGWARSLATLTLPQPPAWVEGLPAVGPRLAQGWQELAAAGPGGLTARLSPYAGKFAGWLISQVGSVGMVVLQFLLTVILAAVLYAGGEKGAASVRRFARRLAGPRGDDAAVLAAKAIRSVALGIVVTALVQSLLGGIGLVVAGVPGAGILTVVIFVCCVAQIGPAPVLLLAVGWTFWQVGTLPGVLLLVWSLGVGSLDNFLRPILIRRGADLPLLLIFSGVIGGLLAFGIIGLFIGPVLLAVSYTLLGAWVEGGNGEPVSEHPCGGSSGDAIRAGSE